MQMPSKAVESIVLQLGQQQLSIHTKALAGSILLCSYRYNSFSRPLLILLYYICHHELKAYNVTAAELQLEPVA
jgi:hypothetical protein